MQALRKHFPGALPGSAIHARVRKVLESDYGFDVDNTIFGTSVCPDEINHEVDDLAELMKDYWGESFSLGGISGVPFSGKTGYMAFSAHVPDNGNILVLYGPHVAISEEGEVGKYLREGQACHSTACGAVIGAHAACLKGDVLAADFDEADMQMHWIKKKLMPHAQRIQATEAPMATLAMESYKLVEHKLHRVINFDAHPKHLALVGGIMINMQGEDHFLP